MNDSEFMELMDELDIPNENITECHEPEDSLKTLQNFESQYDIDTSVVIDKSMANFLPIPQKNYMEWIDAFNTFMEYHGDVALINSHQGEYVVDNTNSQEAGFVNSASFFLQQYYLCLVRIWGGT